MSNTINENEKKYASLETLQIFKENADKLYATQDNVSEISSTLEEKANTLHTHDISDVINLQSTIDEINDDISQKSQVQMIMSDNSNSTSEILSTLKIHKLSQEEYEENLVNGTLEDNAIYLTPDEEIDLSGYATTEQLNNKADVEHNHNEVYYTKTDIDIALENKASSTHNHEINDINGLQNILDNKASQNDLDTLENIVNDKSDSDHGHNDVYYTKTEIDQSLVNKSDITHNHDDKYDSKDSANNALIQAKSYADNVAVNAANAIKNDLLNGAGAAYDTLKELGDLIDENVNAIEALEAIASGKADTNHIHNDIYNTKTEIDEKISTINTSIATSLDEAKSYSNSNLNTAKAYADNAVTQKTQVQIITWEDND